MHGPLSYIGGKNRLAKRIIAIFPKHTTYVEAFAGGAQVFFRKEPSEVEVLNDLDGEIVNFYRVCQQHHEELLRYFRFVVVSREWFDLLKCEPRDAHRHPAGRTVFVSSEKLLCEPRAESRLPPQCGPASGIQSEEPSRAH